MSNVREVKLLTLAHILSRLVVPLVGAAVLAAIHQQDPQLPDLPRLDLEGPVTMAARNQTCQLG